MSHDSGHDNSYERIVPRIEKLLPKKWWHNKFLWFVVAFVVACVATYVFTEVL